MFEFMNDGAELRRNWNAILYCLVRSGGEPRKDQKRTAKTMKCKKVRVKLPGEIQ